MAKRTAPQTTTAGPAFPPLGLVAGPGAPGAISMSVNGMASSYSNAGSAASSSEQPPQNGLPPAPNKFDVSQAQQCRLQDAYWSDEEEDMDCPLCLEEIDLSDANFKPCPCGYQICRFCWHHIKQNLNGRCPACRRKYSDQTVEFKPMTAEEIKKLMQAKKQKEREKKELEAMNRKHLANMRVVQKNLVYVVGLSSKLAKEELIPTLRSNDYFGQYGRISKILISKRTTASKLVMGTSESAIGVYVTYHRKEDAAKAIVAIDGSKGSDGRIVRASYGTTKYCTTYLRNLPCTNPGCTYLHEPGEEADSFTKEDLSTLRHAAKDTENKIKPTSLGMSSIPKRSDSLLGSDSLEGSALPKTASWASGKPVTPVVPMVESPFRESDMPPLSASSASALARKPSGQKPIAAKAVPTRAPSTPTPRLRAAALGRSESPAPPGLSRTPVTSLTFEGAASPQLAKATPPPGLEPVTRESSAAPEEVTKHPVTVGGPPGLAKSTPPPGLGTPSRATAAEDASRSSSVYQPSSSAQALLDDMLQRREAEPETTKPSPFPDFDDALSSFQDGDFCFNFPPAHQQQQVSSGETEFGMPRSGTDLTSAFTTFSPFGAPPSVLAAHASLIGTGTPPPGIVRTPNRSATASPAPFSYSGSFDPFAPGAGETIKEESNATSLSPFAAIEQMKRTLSEDRNNDENQEGSEASKRASRFEFAKRKESDSLGAGIASSPLRAELMLNMCTNGFGGGSDRDGMGMSKDASSLLGNVFEQENAPHQSGMNGFNDAGPPGFGLGREGGYLGLGLARPPGISGPALSNRFGTNTPPPGISAPASRQQQALLASLHQMGGNTVSSPSESMQHMTNGSGANFLAELQQQAAQRAQQQAQYASGDRSNSSTDPLLAILAASNRRQQRDEMPFSDPAIMSMAQAAAHHQQQFGNASAGGRGGGYGSFSPFDQQGGFGGSQQQQHSFSDQQRYLHQQGSDQQQQQHDQRNQYPALS